MSTPIEIIDDLRRRRLTVHSPLSHDEFVTWFAELVDQGKEVDAEDSEALVEACLHVFADGRLRFRLFAAEMYDRLAWEYRQARQCSKHMADLICWLVEQSQ